MILVTGASGFVGRAFTALLDRRGLSYRQVSRAERTGFVTVSDPDGTADWTSDLSGIDTVVHLAGRVHVMQESASDPLAAFRLSNVTATLNLARQAAAAGVQRFLYVSSIKVMAENSPEDRPFSEVDDPAPATDYGVSKLEAEIGLAAIAARSSMSLTVVRPPLVYGPGAKANFLALAKAVHRGIPLPFGLVKNRRSMVFVENLADFLLTCCEAPASAGRTFFISDGMDFSTSDLVRQLASGMGRSAMMLPVPPTALTLVLGMLGQRDLGYRLLGNMAVDIGEARRVLGWEPPVSASEGLQRTVQAMFGRSA